MQGVQLFGVCEQRGDAEIHGGVYLDIQNDIKDAQYGVAWGDCGVLFILNDNKNNIIKFGINSK